MRSVVFAENLRGFGKDELAKNIVFGKWSRRHPETVFLLVASCIQQVMSLVLLEAGNVYLPHPAIAPWVEDFVQEVTSFPNGRHDDQVDAMTQALNRLRDSGSRFHIPESQIVLDPFAIPEEWPRGFGLAVSPGGVAAICGARDSSGRIYLYAEHQLPHAEPSENARAIKAWGEWVPRVLSAVSVPGSNGTRERIAQIYREQVSPRFRPAGCRRQAGGKTRSLMRSAVFAENIRGLGKDWLVKNMVFGKWDE